MSTPHRIIWNWDVSLGNVLSIVLTIGAVAAAALTAYVQYEKRKVIVDERITNVESAVAANGAHLIKHATKEAVHVSTAEAALMFVPRLSYEASEAAQEKRIQEAQMALKEDLNEIKDMVRENGRAGREQYRSLTNRIDQQIDN